MKFLDLFKRFFRNFYKPTPFESNYLFIADLKSSIYVSIIVSVLEIWMIISAFSIKVSDNIVRDFVWIIQHVGAYIFFLVVAIINLIYSISYLLGKTKNKRLGHVLKTVFSITSLVFAIYISYLSYDKSGLTFAFMTIGIYIFCLYVWNPAICLVLVTLYFFAFFILQGTKYEVSYSMKVNGFTAYLLLFVAGLNIYLQRKAEASKEESLQKTMDLLREKNVRDELTGLHNMSHFNHTAEIILQSSSDKYKNLCFAFMDIQNFRNYNEKYGFKKGNELLVRASKIIGITFDDALLARFSDDHFVVLSKYDDIERKVAYIREMLRDEEERVSLGLKVGIYRPKSSDILPSLACDYARYACNSIKRNYSKHLVEYDENMSDELKRKQYVINNIDRAVENHYIKVYYQPVVWAKDSKLAGVEALARWDDPNYGLLPPGIFIPILEEYHLIDKLDLFVMETVCKDIKDYKSNGFPEIPTSINFSRLDFQLIDPVKELEKCINEYGIQKDKIHVEITESALSENDDNFRNYLESFREKGYSLWLDDFGSGYSGLNVLKDYSFDMMKIDMKFVQKFSENNKTQPILSSIVELAQKIGMNTLTEGVETKEAYEFLKSIGCQRIQGYLFGKPMTKEELIKNIKNGIYDISSLLYSS